MVTFQQVPHRRTKMKKIPEYLVREILNGKVLPNIGYREVLSKEKKPSAIRGCSSLQSIITVSMTLFLGTRLNRKKYFIASNETGLHLYKKSNLSNDVAIYKKEGTVCVYSKAAQARIHELGFLKA